MRGMEAAAGVKEEGRMRMRGAHVQEYDEAQREGEAVRQPERK
jgi:hypothetical protein